MQPGESEESSVTGIGSQEQPTRAQRDFALGFEEALVEIYAKRGVPAAVRGRSQSTLSDPDPSATSNSASQLSVECSLSASSTGVVCPEVAGSRSLPAVATDAAVSAPDSPPAPTTIPLCVSLASNDFDSYLLTDEQHCRLQVSTGDCDSTDGQSTMSEEATSGSTSQAEGNAVVEDDKRQKNRSAARRCREKRLEKQRDMRRQVENVGAENVRLETNISRLRSRVEQLQNLLSDHRLGACGVCPD